MNRDASGRRAGAFFQSARPIWPAGAAGQMNASAGFRAVFRLAGDATGAVLRVAARSFYRAWVNGEFAGRGPARGPHGFERVDEWDVGRLLRPGRNLVAIEVNAYHANSYCRADGPG
ncbi:MAG: hypothetical protein N3A38_05265, partial [Planctomycetota bacterium]|nr:hypothetical protein [Planctomycetota bacterium]